jgi:hypothetical protein
MVAVNSTMASSSKWARRRAKRASSTSRSLRVMESA